MNKRKMIWLSMILLVITGLFGISAASAHVRSSACGESALQEPIGDPGGPRGPRDGRGPGHLFHELNLSEAQKEQVKAIHDKARTDAQSLHEQLRPLREEMRAAIEKSSFDEAAVRAILAKEAQIRTEIEVLHARTESAVFNLLSAEQKTKLAELRKNRPGPRHEN